jgi:hypothetical protein
VKYEPWKIVEESFRKHMLSAEEVQKKFDEKKNESYFHYNSPEQYFEEQMHHNFEYFKWYVDKETGSVVFDRHERYEPLGLFYGQYSAIPKIRTDLVNYVERARAHLIIRIAEAVYELQKHRIPCEEIQIPKHWLPITPSNFYGLEIVANHCARVLSEAKYGRFVEIRELE